MSSITHVLPAQDFRRRVAEAVHRGVCEATGSDGMSHCAVYAAAAVKVLARAAGARYVLQAGTLSVRLSRAYREADPEGATHFSMEARASHRGGVCGAAGGLLEFHAWLGRVHGGGRERWQHECVDLSARHYRGWIRPMDGDWPGPGDFADDYLWTTGDRLPDGLMLIPDAETTMLVLNRLDGAQLRGIVSEAARVALAELERPAAPKVGRNEPCVCGSGRKFKKCCLGGGLKAA